MDRNGNIDPAGQSMEFAVLLPDGRIGAIRRALDADHDLVGLQRARQQQLAGLGVEGAGTSVAIEDSEAA